MITKEITLKLTGEQISELHSAISYREYNLTDRKLKGELDADTTRYFMDLLLDIRKQITSQS